MLGEMIGLEELRHNERSFSRLFATCMLSTIGGGGERKS